MAFKINHDEAGENKGFQVLAKGEYEVFPTDFEMSVSANGNLMATFTYKVRDDVGQPGGGQQIRYDRFVETPKALWRVQAASKAAQFEQGIEYDSLEEWANAFKGKAVKVVVDHEERNDKIYPVVKAFRQSDAGGEMSINEDPFANNNGSIVIQDEDLPF